ncbi:hypothetical protein TPHA_0N00140 [Tetrapisispora phaffii CBS 4417]|uniref:DUF218 domain-containing protein n=1 Tax=Tetrapisispora phaffii (strain ATCC 24235 / CBS 4417 / NBRC 1672 / NRRL Y-8282 / UCD 70-5) TaxID=1071381 RepID=G8C0W7_TETPH|nr:hypothetical protein TPHA_0N00140 [Tetrapisispora phaffii CBS 4417]CCE65795.1 hypothetical protein TPHA_0N00140 [Tetrapisispora phaffii CBS 4417]
MNEDQYFSLSKHLILVPCHSIWDPTYRSNDKIGNYGQDGGSWDLADFQKEGHDHISFIKHALKAVQTLIKHIVKNNDILDESLRNYPILIFSGSQTCKTTRDSEAQSYCRVLNTIFSNYKYGSISAFRGDKEIECLIKDIISSAAVLEMDISEIMTKSFITTEEFSLDSFQNVLYSLYRFKEYTDNYPNKITIVGFGFKKERFLNYHLNAINFDLEDVEYISYEPNPLYLNYLKNPNDIKEINNDPICIGYYKCLQKSEEDNALALFKNDWYGIRGKLAEKKFYRNHHKRFPGYKALELISFDGDISDREFFDRFIKGKMPWSKPSKLI